MAMAQSPLVPPSVLMEWLLEALVCCSPSLEQALSVLETTIVQSLVDPQPQLAPPLVVMEW